MTPGTSTAHSNAPWVTGCHPKGLLGKTVSISAGPYKGYLGIVKELTDTMARIELQSISKLVSVDRDRLVIGGSGSIGVPIMEALGGHPHMQWHQRRHHIRAWGKHRHGMQVARHPPGACLVQAGHPHGPFLEQKHPPGHQCPTADHGQDAHMGRNQQDRQMRSH